MFGKEQVRNTTHQNSQTHQPQTQPHSPQFGTPNNSAGHAPTNSSGKISGSVIGSDLTILGDRIAIISQESLQIDGDIRSDVTGKQVTVGRQGSVTGTISAEHVEVNGGVRGAVKAASVFLNTTAQVEAEIMHQNLTIAEGAYFEGRVRRAESAADLAPNLDPNSYAPAQEHHGVQPPKLNSDD